jgi:hypothetical protein
MKKKFKESFIGYKLSDVKMRILTLEKDFELKNSECDKELLALSEENNQIRLEISKLEAQIAPYSNLSCEIKETLYKAHIDACSSIFETEKKFDAMLAYKTDILKMQQAKNSEIKASITNLLEELRRIIYEDAREGEESVQGEQEYENMFIRSK